MSPAPRRGGPIRKRPDSPPDTPLPAPRPSPRRPGLVPTEVADALSAVLAAATAAIRENESGSRDGGDIEHVHQMRVATRRIRAYLKAARPALDAQVSDSLRQHLSGLAGTLGAVRDLDVMIERLHAEAAALGEPDTAALEKLIDSLQSQRTARRAELIAELDRSEFTDLLDELDAATARPPVSDPWADLQGLATKEWKRLAKARATLVADFGDEPPDDDLHALRILGKRARYTAELLKPPKSARRKASAGLAQRQVTATPAAVTKYLTALAHFQEVLGAHQDSCVLEDQLRELVADSANPQAALAAGRVIEGCRLRCEQAMIDYPPAWAAVSKAAGKAFG